MKLTLLGTGCPSVSAERTGAAQVISNGDRHVLVDCGSGVTQRLVQAGLSGRDIDAVLFTHLHSDHIVDLMQLVISSWHQGRDRPHRVFGPPGTRRYVEGLLDLWQPELEQRIAHERRPSTAALRVEVAEFEAGTLAGLEGLSVMAVPVDHRPVEEAYGFHVEAEGCRLMISGDTRPFPALEAAAQGADVLLHEVFVHHALPVVGGLRSEETIERTASYHTLSGQVGKVAQRAGVGCLLLTHFVPPECDREALLNEVSADFPGPVILGEDLMSLDLRTGTLCYRQLHLTMPLIAGNGREAHT
jgi:ribonuclease Z